VSTANSDEQAVQAGLTTFLTAFRNLEWLPFRNSFATDATVFFPFRPTPRRWQPRRAIGREEIEAGFKPFFDRTRAQEPGPPYLVIEPKDIHIQMLNRAAIVTFHLEDPDAFGRRTVIFRQEEDRWVIIHLHASNIPLDE
jgi:hypothetical protein